MEMLLLEDKRILPVELEYRPVENFIAYEYNGRLYPAPVTWVYAKERR